MTDYYVLLMDNNWLRIPTWKDVAVLVDLGKTVCLGLPKKDEIQDYELMQA